MARSLSILSIGHQNVSMKEARHHIDNEPDDDRAKKIGDQGMAQAVRRIALEVRLVSETWNVMPIVNAR